MATEAKWVIVSIMIALADLPSNKGLQASATFTWTH